MATSRISEARLFTSGFALFSELSLPAVLQRTVELAVEVTDARYGALGVLGPDGRIAEFVTSGLTREERDAIDLPSAVRGVLQASVGEAESLTGPEAADDLRSAGFPPNRSSTPPFLGAPIWAQGRLFGELYLADKRDGRSFDEQDERALALLAAQTGVAIGNARQYEELRQRERSLDSVREITNSILAGADATEAIELVTERARELAAAELASISVPTEDGTRLVLQSVSGAHAEQLRGQMFPREGSISGRVIATGKPIVVGDMASDERAYQPVVELGEMGPAVFVPLSVAGEAFGTLAVANLHRGQLFTEDNLRLVETFAAQAAVAIEYARAHDELRRLAVIEDRERIARDLHDDVIQALFAVGMGLQATGALSEDPEVEQRLEQATQELDRVIRDLRNYIFGLRPGILADRQLDQALHELARDFQRKTGVVTVVDVDEAVAAELASRAGDLVQLTRETLSNVGQHSGAETCSVRLRRNGGREAVLEIGDDGRGFDVGAPGEGHGLPNIRDRARSLGGRAEIWSAPAEGTTVTVTIPA